MFPSEPELIARIRQGQRHLYARLLDRYKDKGFSLALRILKNRQDAEEVLQDSFVRAYRGLDRFEGASSFGTWFYRILYNSCMDVLERRKKASIMSGEDDMDMLPDPTVEHDEMETDLEIKDMMGHVRRVISEMPPKYASILSMYYMQELTYREISEVAQLPEGTVKTHLFRARLYLQKEIMKELRGEKVAL